MPDIILPGIHGWTKMLKTVIHLITPIMV